MTNYNERLDETVERIRRGMHRELGSTSPHLEAGYTRDEAKQAINSLTKELVAEAKPSKKHIGDEVAENRSYTGERLFNATIDEYHTSLLKALEEV